MYALGVLDKEGQILKTVLIAMIKVINFDEKKVLPAFNGCFSYIFIRVKIFHYSLCVCQNILSFCVGVCARVCVRVRACFA